MIRDGRPNKEIAARLEVTPRAVELRRASLMRKLGVSSLPELLRLTIGSTRRLRTRSSSSIALIPIEADRACLEFAASTPRFRTRRERGSGCATLRFCEGTIRRTLRSSVKESRSGRPWHDRCF